MRFLITNDLHQQNQKWKLTVAAVKAEKPQWVFITGDLLPKQPFTLASQRDFFKHIERYLTEIKKLGVESVLTYLGNDDMALLEGELLELQQRGLCLNMNQFVYRGGGFAVAGMPFVRDYPFGMKTWCAPDGPHIVNPVQYTKPVTMGGDGRWLDIPNLADYLKSKKSIGAMLNELDDQIPAVDKPNAIYMVHQPPSLCGMDICGNGAQVGSPTVLTFIERTQPLLTMHGHIHESPYQPGGRWHKQVGRTHVLQPGQLGSKLHYVVADISDGAVKRLVWNHSRSAPEVLEF